MNSKSEADFDLKQKIINKVTETAIASRVESAGKIDVNLDSDLPHLLQGQTNSLKITGEKIIAIKDIQLEKIDITCNDLSLNLTQALLGKIAFEQPGNFAIKLIFTESDCDHLLNSEYVRVLLQNLVFDIAGESAYFYFQQAKCSLESDGNLSLTAAIVLHRQQQTKTARFKIDFQFYQQGAGIKFFGGQYLNDKALDWNETAAIMTKASQLLDLRHFANENLALEITNIQIKDKQLIINSNTKIKKLPDSITQSIKSVTEEINH